MKEGRGGQIDSPPQIDSSYTVRFPPTCMGLFKKYVSRGGGRASLESKQNWRERGVVKPICMFVLWKKLLEIKETSLCLGKVFKKERFLKNFSVDNMKNIGFNGYFYDFSVDYDAISVDDILDIHKYLKQSMV